MKYLNQRDFFRRKNYLRIEPEYIKLKALTFNRILPKSVRFFFFMKLNRIGKNFSKVRIKNRCIITNRSQSVYRDLRVNRTILKQFLGNDFLTGIRKSSW
jgi:small subunit ribosomal protein S14